jgi:exopolysaccharide biosynthesis WecB/TagA/CpsF family protein
VTVLDVPIASITATDALAQIEALHDRPSPAVVAFANAHTLNLAVTDPAFANLLRRVDLLLNDGSGVALAARLQGERFPDNLNGTDLTPKVLSRARDLGWRIFLLGARAGVAARARDRLLESLPGLQVVGVHDGYFPKADEPGVIADVRAADVDLLVVAMGNPRQEHWLAEHQEATGARVGLAVGAFLDFTAGVVPRAPAVLSQFGMEWAYRLYLEPRRMWRRYVLGNPLFLARVALDTVRRRPRRHDSAG